MKGITLTTQWDIFWLRGGLDDDEWYLQGGARAEACEDLVADPCACCGTGFEGRNQSCGDGFYDGAVHENRYVETDSGEQEAG